MPFPAYLEALVKVTPLILTYSPYSSSSVLPSGAAAGVSSKVIAVTRYEPSTGLVSTEALTFTPVPSANTETLSVTVISITMLSTAARTRLYLLFIMYSSFWFLTLVIA